MIVLWLVHLQCILSQSLDLFPWPSLAKVVLHLLLLPQFFGSKGILSKKDEIVDATICYCIDFRSAASPLRASASARLSSITCWNWTTACKLPHQLQLFLQSIPPGSWKMQWGVYVRPSGISEFSKKTVYNFSFAVCLCHKQNVTICKRSVGCALMWKWWLSPSQKCNPQLGLFG